MDDFQKLIYAQNKMSTIYGDFRNIDSLIKHLINEKIMNPEHITLYVVKDYIEKINKRYHLERVRSRHKGAFASLLRQISEDNPEADYQLHINELEKIDNKKDKIQRKSNRTPIIDEEYITDLVSSAVQELQNSNLSNRQIEEACVVLLLSQTGMRIGELRLLEANKRKKLSILNGSHKASYLEFKTFKTVKQSDYRWTNCVLNEIAERAYEVLEKITEEKRKAMGTEYLFTSKKRSKVPRVPQSFRNDILKFVARNHKKINCINLKESSLSACTVSICKNNYNYLLTNNQTYGLKDSDVIYIPRPHQFRVTLATTLYEKGVNIDWIREHMNHLSEEMSIHYIRFDKERSRKDHLLKEMVKTLHNDVSGIQSKKQLIRKIDKFVKENNMNIHINIMDVITEINREVPIREKEQGYCIKSSFGRKCPKNESIDIKENLYIHLVNCELLDITYNRFKKIQHTIEYNKNAGFSVEASREEKRMKKLLDSYLIPEFEDLMNELSVKDQETVITEYPHLKEIVVKIDEKWREILFWNKKLS